MSKEPVLEKFGELSKKISMDSWEKGVWFDKESDAWAAIEARCILIKKPKGDFQVREVANGKVKVTGP